MATITIAGLGPGRRGLRTLETVQAIESARKIVLRTLIHPETSEFLGDPRVVACDDIYESLESFKEVYAAIADRVCLAADDGDVLYLAPGHPRYGEFVTPLIEARAAEHGHEIVVFAAVSALDEIAVALGADLMSLEPQSIDATTLVNVIDAEPFAAGLLDVSTVRPVLVTQVYSPEMASATKLALSRVFPDDHDVCVVTAAGTDARTVTTVPLHELDRVHVDHLTSVWVGPRPDLSAGRDFPSLARIVARLRAPGGCPWDQKQTTTSLLDSLLEEAYEAVEAFQQDDHAHGAEELGDLLMIIAMQSQIAEEEGLFQIEDVIEGITAKLLRRHPHVFGDETARSAEDVVGIWQAVKATEGKKTKPAHPLDRYPKPMPIAQRLVDHLRPSDVTGSIDNEALGDQLFALTMSAIEAGLNPETLLLEAAKRAIPETPVS
jgi:tetrapyrrole methylase family protein/MazG family protein